ncbi:hypothetical protein JCM11491_005597 [Sporobolomyces phaffii]
MPKIDHAGFAAALCVPLETRDRVGHVAWHEAVELGLAHAQDPDAHCAFVELPAGGHPVRAYFSRDPTTAAAAAAAVTAPEVFAAYLTVYDPSGTAGPVFYKCFAVVDVVVADASNPPPPPWFIESRFGDVPQSLHELSTSYVELRVCRATAKPGTVLGDGLLDPEQIEAIDRTDVAICFRWYYATRAQLGSLGLVALANSTPEGGGAGGTAIEWVRAVNEQLISQLDPGQRRQFVESLVATGVGPDGGSAWGGLLESLTEEEGEEWDESKEEGLGGTGREEEEELLPRRRSSRKKKT